MAELVESEVSQVRPINSNFGISNVQREADALRPINTSDSVEEYIKLVEEEKQNWRDYIDILKKQYNDLKRDVMSKKKISLENVNYLDYLPEEEKEFLMELQKTKQDCSFIQQNLSTLNESIYAFKTELENQRNFITQKLSMKKNELETSLPDNY